MSKKRVVIGMSGGVDSSVSAWLLKQQGYEVIGLFMKNWEDDDNSEYCSTREDLIDAVSVADVVGVELHRCRFCGGWHLYRAKGSTRRLAHRLFRRQQA